MLISVTIEEEEKEKAKDKFICRNFQKKERKEENSGR